MRQSFSFQAAAFALLPVALTCATPGCAFLPIGGNSGPGSSPQLIERAQRAEQRGNLDQAQQLLIQAVRRSPDDPAANRELAELLVTRGRTDAAIEHFRRAIEGNPDDPQSRVALARALFDQKRFAEAAALLDRVLRTAPNHLEALLLKSRLAAVRGGRDRALALSHRALQIDPENIEARLQIADLHLQSGRADRAAPLLRAVCRSSEATVPQTAQARWKLGIAYSEQGRWDEAAASLAAASRERTSMTADDWYRLAYAYHKAGQPERSREALQRVLAEQPQHADARALASALAGSHASQALIPVDHAESTVPTPPGR